MKRQPQPEYICIYVCVCIYMYILYTHAHTYIHTWYSILAKSYIHNLQDFLLFNNKSIKNEDQWQRYSPKKKLEWLKGANNC